MQRTHPRNPPNRFLLLLNLSPGTLDKAFSPNSSSCNSLTEIAAVKFIVAVERIVRLRIRL
jgi:hypothetical protein